MAFKFAIKIGRNTDLLESVLERLDAMGYSWANGKSALAWHPVNAPYLMCHSDFSILYATSAKELVSAYGDERIMSGRAFLLVTESLPVVDEETVSVGDTIRIVGNTSNHKFAIGSKAYVTSVEYDDEKYVDAIGTNENTGLMAEFFVRTEDFEVIKKC